ncbi:hypothetical protein BaRGS_00035052 [Batillaria attramentaria]|uniref:Uncharacterized protein n=1 Tax=Batillaria attramentaria TaxID=370345 RepID=A0ABD0JFX2_9CAEN
MATGSSSQYGTGQSAAGYLGAAVLRGLLAMSVSRSLDLDYKNGAGDEATGGKGRGGRRNSGGGIGGVVQKKVHSLTRTKDGNRT